MKQLMRVNGKSNRASEGRRLNIPHLFNPIGFRILPPPSGFFSIPFSLWERSTSPPPPRRKEEEKFFSFLGTNEFRDKNLIRREKEKFTVVETPSFLVVNCNSRMDIVKNIFIRGTKEQGEDANTPLETDAFFLQRPCPSKYQAGDLRRKAVVVKKIKIPKTTFGGAKQAFLPFTCPHFVHVLFRPLGNL